jgi:hypothetical protein
MKRIFILSVLFTLLGGYGMANEPIRIMNDCNISINDDCDKCGKKSCDGRACKKACKPGCEKKCTGEKKSGSGEMSVACKPGCEKKCCAKGEKSKKSEKESLAPTP